ncbi:glycogen debranching enzyme N-terminal domain-containing protein [Candidatus Woesearchaeota archaeon]|nr:glycogen debranching enzyme N-terminal domain-containing protein [Candidatus Woesearchaeota archaeon]
MLIFTKEDIKLDLAREKEWIITNGLGGYSSSTILGLNTRKYHGLLVTSLNKKLNRNLLLSKFEEHIIIGKNYHNLSIDKYSNTNYQKNKHLEGFVYNVYPTFNYKVENIDIIKSICMVHDKNAIIISYKIISDKNFTIKIRPLVNCREYNKLTKEPDWVFDQIASQRTTVIRPSYEQSPAIIIGCDRGTYKQKGIWYNNMEYEQEIFRGHDYIENHFCPGEFIIDIKKGISTLNFLVVGDKVDEAYSTFDNLYSLDYKEYKKFFEYEVNRIKSMIKLCYNFNNIKEDKLLPYLIQASDSFIVKNQKSITAGYHWLYEQGRDSMISLPGLCLATGRINDAKDILLKYAKHCSYGLVPDKINPEEIKYNSIDTSLWFIHAVYKFYKYTNNLDFIKINLWNKIKEIIDYYKYGTNFNIAMKHDGLISSEHNSPLTWMNSKYTLRKGKCVEINALWYNSLKIAELFAKRFNEDFEQYIVISNMVKKAFNDKFWNDEEKCLYDRIEKNNKDSSIRPNQIFAVSLPFSILNLRKEYMIVKKITEEILTPYGLRSLTPKDKNYIGFCVGSQEEREKAHYNGAVWGWLLGHYIDAYLKIHNYSEKGKQEIEEKIIKHIAHNIKDYGLGTVSEMYDGEHPHISRGCISNACSVAEIIRVYIENILRKKNNVKWD